VLRGRHKKGAPVFPRSGARSRTSADRRIVLLTSRVSVEMVGEDGNDGAGIIAAVSAPTALAVRASAAAGITLVAVVRDDSLKIFTRRERISAR
jgi:FdhD protein